MLDPNEFVEAAAKALHHDWPTLFGWDETWEELRKDGRGEYRTVVKSVLTAVLPLIEQRVKDECSRGKRARASMTDPFPSEPRNEGTRNA